MILETQRLFLRELTDTDLPDLREILQDEDVMYAYEHAFCEAEVQEWLLRQQRRYRKDGVGLWAVIEKETGEFVGQCGLTFQDCAGEKVLEIGYLFKKRFWHQGYAIEAAQGCKHYAFETLGAETVCSIIRENNLASQKVALSNGMLPTRTVVKHYHDVDMPHIVFSINKPRPACY